MPHAWWFVSRYYNQLPVNTLFRICYSICYSLFSNLISSHRLDTELQTDKQQRRQLLNWIYRPRAIEKH